MSLQSLTLVEYASDSVYGLPSGYMSQSNFDMCYVPTSNATPGSLKLKDLWTAGIIFYCDAPLGDASASPNISSFVMALNALTSEVSTSLTGCTSGKSKVSALTCTGMVWLSGVADALAGTGALTINNYLSFNTDVTTSVTTIDSLQKISFGSYHLAFSLGTIVQYGNGFNTFNFQNHSLNSPSIYWYNEENKKMGTVGPSVNSSEYTIENSSISFSLLPYKFFGCWVFPTTLEKDTGKNLENDIQLFKVGFQYYNTELINDPRNLEKPPKEVPSTYFYPLFDISTSSLTLFGQLDSLNIGDASRTSFSFIEVGAYASVPTCFRSLYGKTIHWIPNETSLLVFTPRPSETGETTYYLAPQGSYDIDPSNFASLKQIDILCGISGLECLSIENDTGTGSTILSGIKVCFAVGQEGYLNTLISNPFPKGTTKTSWMTIAAPIVNTDQEVFYNLQPKHQHLYEVGAQGEPWDALILPVRQLINADTPATDAYFPMVPYAGVTERTNKPQLMGKDGLNPAFYDNYEEYEFDFLAPKRKSLIEAAFPDSTSKENKVHYYGAIPSGLSIGLTEDKSKWLELIFANGLAATGGDQKLYFDNIIGGFRSALQSNELFIVISQHAKNISGFTTNSPMNYDVGGWTFDFDLENWDEHNTICVFKYQKGTLYDLAKNTDKWKWTDACEIDGSNNETQTQLLQILNDVESKKGVNPNYQHFWDNIVNNEKWQGVLFFNCPMSLDSIPPEFALLSNGISTSDFYAHHIGFSLTPVKGTIGTAGTDLKLEMDVSSTFGLVDYQDAEKDWSVLANYGYKVKSLEVRFVNSASVNFKGEVLLQINELFEHEVQLLDATGSLAKEQYITLAGSSQLVDGHMNISFQNIGDSNYQVSNSVLNQITLDTISFFALNTPPTTAVAPSTIETVKSRFLMSGDVNFTNLADPSSTYAPHIQKENYDLFSYENIGYHKLYLDMSFDFGKKNSTSFDLNIADMTFDTGNLTLRPPIAGIPRSLAGSLPLRLTGFVSSFSGQSVKQMGYMPVNISSFKGTTDVKSTWYGMNFDLNLGSLGALSDNKSFILDVLLVWSPNGKSDDVWLGIKVPGMSANGTFFQLEDLIKLGVQDVVLQQNGAGGPPEIVFQSIGLSILGQTIPPGGTTDMAIFGGTNNNSKLLAWLAAYKKNTTIPS